MFYINICFWKRQFISWKSQHSRSSTGLVQGNRNRVLWARSPSGAWLGVVAELPCACPAASPRQRGSQHCPYPLQWVSCSWPQVRLFLGCGARRDPKEQDLFCCWDFHTDVELHMPAFSALVAPGAARVLEPASPPLPSAGDSRAKIFTTGPLLSATMIRHSWSFFTSNWSK